ncbi:MAG: class I SAM-dependent methyltransferase [Candidatus Pacebacteria bacterium]|nr:class I SAM-dependent methyltransferase [Candidatus Paceibacterota bacterium]
MIDHDMRRLYEIYLPVREFLHDLRRLALFFLPHPSWLPRVLRDPHCDRERQIMKRPPSLPDLWRILPVTLAGKVTYHEDELPVLFCALADPPAFGTDFGRYPRQKAELRKRFGTGGKYGLRVLDVACGTGQGTYELGKLLSEATGCPPGIIGVTREPLEAWMAANRRLPHRPDAASRFQRTATHGLTEFVAGDIGELPFAPRAFDLIVANGIVGGPYWNQRWQILQFLRQCHGLLKPRGVVTVTNRFHEGRRNTLERLLGESPPEGWCRTEAGGAFWFELR